MELAIVGAGIGGLSLAVALKRRGLRATVYERDASLDARKQGYALGLIRSAGLRVLDELGLGPAIERVGRPASDFVFVDARGRRLMGLKADPASPEATLGVPRSELRQVLLEALEPSQVVWGARCTGLEEQGAGVQLSFENGREVQADRVVVCDGAASALRSGLHGDALGYLGLTSIGGLLDRPVDHPLLAGGAFMTVGRGQSLFVQTYAVTGETIWSWCGHAQEGQFDGMGPEALLAEVRRRTEGWHEPVAALLEATRRGEVIARAYYDRMPPASMGRGRVIVIGDAAHAMSPFQGRGANTAMEDALELAEALAVGPEEGLEGRLAAWDRKAVQRGRQMVSRSRFAARVFHARGAVGCWLRDRVLQLMDAGLQRAARRQLSASTSAPPAP